MKAIIEDAKGFGIKMAVELHCEVAAMLSEVNDAMTRMEEFFTCDEQNPLLEEVYAYKHATLTNSDFRIIGYKANVNEDPSLELMALKDLAFIRKQDGTAMLFGYEIKWYEHLSSVAVYMNRYLICDNKEQETIKDLVFAKNVDFRQAVYEGSRKREQPDAGGGKYCNIM